MEQYVYVEKVDSVPKGASVYHYDELDEPSKNRLPTLIDVAPTQVSGRQNCILSSGDYVKYTDYYRITFH